jgi:ketosteroid isomerase-like protein
MSQENVRVFEEARDAVSRGDIEGFLRLVDEDVVWIAGRSAVEGAYRGHDGLRKFFADSEENFEVFEPDFREVLDLGDRILVFGAIHIRARGSAVETDIPKPGSSRSGMESSSDGRTFASADSPSKPRGCRSRAEASFASRFARLSYPVCGGPHPRSRCPRKT